MNRFDLFFPKLREEKFDSFIVTNSTNIFYLCGFRGVSPQEREAVLIFSPEVTLITARLYQNEARKLKSKDLKVEIVNERAEIFELARKLLKKARKTGFEEEDLRFSEYSEFKKSLKGKLVPVKNFIEDLRISKTEDEIARIKKAQEISQKAFEKLLKTIKAGQTEVEVSEKLTKIIKDLGGESLAFESIVATGANSGLPHYVTGREKLKKGEVLLLDFGAKYKDYCADISRTIFLGKPEGHKENIYNLVFAAQKRVIDKISHGLPASRAYEAANKVFKDENFADNFLHGLGHGVGLEVHEAPYLRSTVEDELTERMVFSVEPGLYFPWGGVRIEDLVVIRDGRAKVLGKLSEGIIIL